ncbi:hypothetical protein BJX70DRAFT_379690 [Aspergillus crustosus]
MASSSACTFICLKLIFKFALYFLLCLFSRINRQAFFVILFLPCNAQFFHTFGIVQQVGPDQYAHCYLLKLDIIRY